MKKFIILKSKSDSGNQSPPQAEEGITTLEEQRALLERAKPVQPPLPLEPPPATPIDFSLPQKKEIEDPEYQIRSHSPLLHHQEDSSASYIPSQSEEPSEKPKKTICRDFIRGTCSRGSSCKFAHERDLSQLPGVYTFCKNYQNTVCTYPYCKYVHASIFEEQRFYRTGILPPHALAHHKKPNVLLPNVLPPNVLPPNVLLPPPPPPPEEQNVPNFANPPPVMVPSFEKPDISCVPTANLGSRPIDDFMINPPPRDIDHKAKKCKSCDTMEFRLQFNKDKTENMKQSSKELKNKMAILKKKTHTLYTVLFSLMKPQVAKRPEGFNGLSTLLSYMGDSEKNHLSNMLLKETSEQNLMSDSRES